MTALVHPPVPWPRRSHPLTHEGAVKLPILITTPAAVFSRIKANLCRRDIDAEFLPKTAITVDALMTETPVPAASHIEERTSLLIDFQPVTRPFIPPPSHGVRFIVSLTPPRGPFPNPSPHLRRLPRSKPEDSTSRRGALPTSIQTPPSSPARLCGRWMRSSALACRMILAAALQLDKLTAAGEEDVTSAAPVERERKRTFASFPSLVEANMPFPVGPRCRVSCPRSSRLRPGRCSSLKRRPLRRAQDVARDVPFAVELPLTPFQHTEDAHLLLMDRHPRGREHAHFHHDHDLHRIDSDHVGNHNTLRWPDSESSGSFFRIAVLTSILYIEQVP